MKVQENQSGSFCQLWMGVGVGLGVMFSYIVGNAAVGLVIGLCLSFLIGIFCNRFISKAF